MRSDGKSNLPEDRELEVIKKKAELWDDLVKKGQATERPNDKKDMIRRDQFTKMSS